MSDSKTPLTDAVWNDPNTEEMPAKLADLCRSLEQRLSETQTKAEFWERDSMNAHTGANRLGDQRDNAHRALQGLVDHYTRLVNSGDAGNWDPEQEPVLVAARTSLRDSIAYQNAYAVEFNKEMK